jgi:hypothetical protein
MDLTSMFGDSDILLCFRKWNKCAEKVLSSNKENERQLPRPAIVPCVSWKHGYGLRTSRAFGLWCTGAQCLYTRKWTVERLTSASSTHHFPSHQSQSHITTDGQSASQSWCQAPSGAQDQIFVTVRHLKFCRWGAPSLTRGWVCHRSRSQRFESSICCQYVLTICSCTCIVHGGKSCYVYTIYTRPLSVQAWYSSSCPN